MSNQFDTKLIPAAYQAAVLGAISPVASFEFENIPVRIVNQDGIKIWVAKDAANILEFANPRQAVRSHVSKGDRYGVQFLDTMGRKQTLLGVNESGLFAMNLAAKTPRARRFKDYVTGTILPEIRRTGSYKGNQSSVPMIEMVTAALRTRGKSKSRQVDKIRVHENGSFDVRCGRQWKRNLSASEVLALPPSHALRVAVSLSSLQLAGSPEVKQLIQ